MFSTVGLLTLLSKQWYHIERVSYKKWI